jgi:hypothetical protein
MSFREIVEQDQSDVVTLLTEGFPRRRPTYWQRGLENIRALPQVQGYPRYGYLLEEDGAAQGVILLLSTLTNNNAPRANVSAWYVRQGYRTKAPLLYKLATRQKSGLHVNISPAAHVVPIARAFGFKPYTNGLCLIDARASLRPAHGWRLTRYDPKSGGTLPGLTADVAARHHGYGCSVLLLENGTGPVELLTYRLKLIKGFIPCAQMLHGTPDHVLAAAGPLMRHLSGRGIFLALVDIDEATETSGFHRYPGRNLRYAKGGTPAIGDLVDSEYAVFGP